jgi:hypothetical protein
MTFLRVLVLLATLSVFAGCSILHGPDDAPSRDPGALRTFVWDAGTDEFPVACPAYALVDPLDGHLRGDPEDPVEPIWIEDAGGRRLSVIWPAGFTVSFEPDAVLRDDRGKVVARENEPVELSQVEPSAHSGTFEDPYVATGLLFHGCYAPGI